MKPPILINGKKGLREEVASGSKGVQWMRLEIISASQVTAADKTGKVEFRAYYRADGREEVLHELSRFKKHSGRWFYLDGVFSP